MIRFFLLLLVLSAVISCKKDEEDVRTPGVDEYIDLNLPSYLELNVPGNYVYYPAGGRGIIIYRRSASEFSAYERTCTFDPQLASGLVEVENGNTTAADSVCGSRYSIFDGSIVNGPATRPLSQYRTELLQGNILHIFN